MLILKYWSAAPLSREKRQNQMLVTVPNNNNFYRPSYYLSFDILFIDFGFKKYSIYCFMMVGKVLFFCIVNLVVIKII